MSFSTATTPERRDSTVGQVQGKLLVNGQDDGDDAAASPFEGPEKLLEIWFAPSDDRLPTGATNPNGLRVVPGKVWDEMLDLVCCKVLSVIHSEEVDAYLLSESSMFVWSHKLILKTCGTTTLLLGLPMLLKIAAERCGLKGVWRCFYSRKSFMFPERQRGPHRDWMDEVGFLDKIFQNSSAYTVGRMNGDHWLLYLTPPQDDVLLPDALASTSDASTRMPKSKQQRTPSFSARAFETLSNALRPALPRPMMPLRTPSSRSLSTMRSTSSNGARTTPPDQTLEILMSRLSPRSRAAFYHPAANDESPLKGVAGAADSSNEGCHQLGAKLARSLGLTALLPRATFDSFLFEPCGFSLNAVENDRYATIHVTPEEGYSYASFECNHDFAAAADDDGSSGVEEGESEKAAARRRRRRVPSPRSVGELVERVLDIFEPERLSITLFVSDEDEDEDEDDDDSDIVVAGENESGKRIKEVLKPDLLRQYKRIDKILYEFDGYKLVYAVFEQR